MRRALSLVVLVFVVAATATTAHATQFGAGLHYQRSVGDFDVDDLDKNDFTIFGSVTFPVALVKVEGDVELTPDYLGSDNVLIQPAAYGLLDLGLAYGGLGIGIGYLDGEWATNPFYALRGGVELGLGGLAVDGFLEYRFQNASFGDAISDLNLDAFRLGAQVKFGG